MAINNNQTTPKDAQEALKKILNLDNSTNPDYEYTDPIEGVDIVQTPKDKLETPIGIREDGVLQLIDPNAINDFYYKISFPGTNTLVNAKLTEGLGFSWTPTGNWIIGQNGTEVYEVTENVELKLKALNESSQWIIIGVKNPLTIIPGADAITRFSSQFIVHNDYISMTNGESVATIEQDTDEYLQQALDDDTIIVVEENDIILKKNSSQERVTDDYIVITNGISLTTIGEDEQQFLQDALNENSTIVVEENDIILKKDTSIEKITNDEIFLQTQKSKIDMTDESITLTNDYTKELTYLGKKILKDNPNNYYSQINVAEDKLTLLNGNSQVQIDNTEIIIENEDSSITLSDNGTTIQKGNTTFNLENNQVTIAINNANTNSGCPDGSNSENQSSTLELLVDGTWAYINGQKICVCPCGSGGSGTTCINTTLTVSPASGQGEESVNLTGVLTGNNNPIPNELIIFSVNGNSIGTATTDSSGTAILSYTITETSGSYSIDVTFGGDSIYCPSEGTNTLTVTGNSLIPTTIIIPTQTYTSGSIGTLVAKLVDVNGEPISGQQLWVFFPRVKVWPA